MYQNILHPSWGLIIGLIIAYLVILYAALDSVRGWVFFLAIGVAVVAFWSISAAVLVAGISYTISNPVNSVVAVAAFIILGIFVALLKWRAYVIERIGYGMSTSDEKKDLEFRLNSAKNFIPSAKKNKARISGWISYWPFYTLDYVILLVFRDLFDKVAEWTVGMFNSITDKVSNNAIESYRKEALKNLL